MDDASYNYELSTQIRSWLGTSRVMPKMMKE